MNVRVVALFVFLGIVGTGLSVHFRKQVVVETDPRKNTDDIPIPPKHGPFAKAVVRPTSPSRSRWWDSSTPCAVSSAKHDEDEVLVCVDA